MKKIDVKLIAFAAIAAAAVSCSNFQDDVNPHFVRSGKTVFMATREGTGPETRTIRQGDGSTAWLPGEAIGVTTYSPSGRKYFTEFTSQNTDIAETAAFSGDLEFDGSQTVFACYPYDYDTDYYVTSGQAIFMSLRAAQEAVAGNFSDNAFPAVAKSTSRNLYFRNIAGGIKFSVTRNDIKSVSFRGNNGENLAGDFKITFDDDDVPVAEIYEVFDYGHKEVTLFAPGGGTFEPGKDYYMTLAPAELTKGFTISFRTADKKGTFVSDSPQTVKRSVFGSLGSIDTRVTEWKSMVPEMVDLGLGVKWASWNIGATSPEESGSYYSWGETEEKLRYTKETYRFYDPENDDYTKYISYNTTTQAADDKYWLDMEDDVARAVLGEDWRMPSDGDVQVLLEKCNWEESELNGIMGYRVTSKVPGYTDKSIFLPRSGYKTTDLLYEGLEGRYWIRTRSDSYCDFFGFSDYLTPHVETSSRIRGYSVRAVSGDIVPVTGISLSSTSLDLKVGEEGHLVCSVEPENASYRALHWESSDESVVYAYEGSLFTHDEGSAVISAVTVDGKFTATCEVNVSYAVPEAVDLGLSVKWADINLGAATPGGTGLTFAWGETVSKDGYWWDEYKFNLGADENGPFSKYVTDPEYGTVDGKHYLDLEDDAAHAILGEDWRIPTDSEWQELMDNCDYAWTTENGVNGYKFTSKVDGYTDKSIIIQSQYPAFNDLHDLEYGSYLMTAFLPGTRDLTTALLTSSRPVLRRIDCARAAGLSIRPVYGKVVRATGLSIGSSMTIYTEQRKRLELNVQPENATYKAAAWTSSDPSIATVDEYGYVYGKKPGTVVITARLLEGGFTAECNVTVEAFEPELVDLGLSVKWASCNVGAFSPEDRGNLYAWGETQTKDSFTHNNYKFCSGYSSSQGAYQMTKYVLQERYGTVDNKLWLEAEDDVASVIYGGDWRIPTHSEFQELMDKCNYTWTTENGVSGYRFTSKVDGYTDKSIFIPAAGFVSEYDSSVDDFRYPTAVLSGMYDDRILTMCREPSGLFSYSYERYVGQPVRAVYGARVHVTGISLPGETLVIEPGTYTDVPVTIMPADATLKYMRAVSSDESVVTISSGYSSSVFIEAVGFGTATVTVTTLDGGYTASFTVKVGYAEPDVVDLGLSVKWAANNISFRQEDGWTRYGTCMQWGDAGVPKQDYTSFTNLPYWWKKYPYNLGNDKNGPFSKYVTDPAYGTVDHKIALDPGDDFASTALGGDWRLPTNDEARELIENCDWTFDLVAMTFEFRSKVPGYTGNSIKVPCAFDNHTAGIPFRTHFWTSELSDGTTPWSLTVSEGGPSLDSWPDGRVYAHYLLPVQGALVPIEDIDIENSVSIPAGGTTKLIPTFTPSNATHKIVTWSTSDASVVTVDADGVLTGVSAGTAAVRVYAADGEHIAECAVTVREPDPEAVDLGLSVKWSNRDLGSSRPEVPGDAFAWGETETKNYFDWSSYKFNLGSDENGPFIKYVTDKYLGTPDHKTALDPEDDAATAAMGGDWRMPSVAEIEELLSGCYWNWTTVNGVSGYKVSGKKSGYTDKWIFIPVGAASKGLYWSSDMKNDLQAYALDFSSSATTISGLLKPVETPTHIRPVQGALVPVSGVSLSSGSLELVIGATSSLAATVSPANATHKRVTWTSSDEGVARVDGDGTITAAAVGTATITAYAADGTHNATCTVTVSEHSPYEFVDLGLSVKWAACNVGAENPEDPGDYFAWGGLSTQTAYNVANDRFNNGTTYRGPFSKYVLSADYGTVDGKGVLELQDDAAHSNMGGGWRMPTRDEFDELIKYCRWVWTTVNGVNGYLVKSNIQGYRDQEIFLPAAGYMYETNCMRPGNYGSYWASTIGTKTCNADYLYITSSDHERDDNYRYFGRNIRPVTK